MNEWERTMKRTDEKHKYSCIVPSHLFTFDCLLLKCERLWKFPLLLHHIHRPPPSTEIILRNLMLSFIRLPNHSVENVCKYPFSICFIHACSLCLFVRFHSVWQFCYSFACPSLSVDHHFVYGCKMRNKIRNILAHFFPLSHSSHWPCAQHYISFHKIFPFTTCFHLPFIVHFPFRSFFSALKSTIFRAIIFGFIQYREHQENLRTKLSILVSDGNFTFAESFHSFENT